jgi:SHS2 domain-containing protein
VDRLRERGLVEVKAVTYHGLAVEEAPGRARVRATLDL